MHNYKILLYAYGGLLKPSAPTRHDLTCFFVYGDSPKSITSSIWRSSLYYINLMSNGEWVVYSVYLVYGQITKGP